MTRQPRLPHGPNLTTKARKNCPPVTDQSSSPAMTSGGRYRDATNKKPELADGPSCVTSSSNAKSTTANSSQLDRIIRNHGVVRPATFNYRVHAVKSSRPDPHGEAYATQAVQRRCTSQLSSKTLSR